MVLKVSNLVFFTLFILTYIFMSLWFRDVISEGTYIGHHTLAVQRGINIGVGVIHSIRSILFFSYILSFFS